MQYLSQFDLCEACLWSTLCLILKDQCNLLQSILIFPLTNLAWLSFHLQVLMLCLCHCYSLSLVSWRYSIFSFHWGYCTLTKLFASNFKDFLLRLWILLALILSLAHRLSILLVEQTFSCQLFMQLLVSLLTFLMSKNLGLVDNS